MVSVAGSVDTGGELEGDVATGVEVLLRRGSDAVGNWT